MNRAKFAVALLLGALAGTVAACGASRPVATPSAPTQGTTHVYAENRVSGNVDLQKVSVVIDGEEAGGLSAEELGGGGIDRLRLASVQLPEGSHTLTVHARAAHRATSDVLVLSATQGFEVGREPVSLTARLSVPTGASGRARLQVDFAVEGGTLEGVSDRGVPSSCDALPPKETAICVTEAMLREAIAEHDAPRVVCVDELLARMRQLSRFHVEEAEQGVPGASRHEVSVGKDVTVEISRLLEEAKRCSSAKAAEALLD